MSGPRAPCRLASAAGPLAQDGGSEGKAPQADKRDQHPRVPENGEIGLAARGEDLPQARAQMRIDQGDGDGPKEGGGHVVARFSVFDGVMLDWWIAGASINRTTFNVRGRADLSEVGQEDRAAVEETLEDEDVFGGAFNVHIHDNGGSANGAMTTPGFRTGLCIGIRL